MAKTLIIKDADFAANKLATVVFASIPCTWISVSPSSVTATTDDPVTITATLTPANTTDRLTWATSDSSVVTVLNGVLSIVGNGTATVTATCGNQTATVSVTVNMERFASPQWEWRTSTVNSSNIPTYTAPSTANATKYITAFGIGNEATDYELPCETTAYVDNPYAIKIPSGTTKIKVSATSTSAFYDGTGSRVCWTKDESGGVPGQPRNVIKGIQRVDFNDKNVPETLEVPSGADSFTLTMRFTDNQTFDTANACAENYGITIEFLTE